MSDNHRQYRTIRNALHTCYPFAPEGRLARHLTTLAALVSGIVSSQRTHLPAIAQKTPDAALVESRVKRFRRFITNERIDWSTYYLPYVVPLLQHLAQGDLAPIWWTGS